MEITCVEVEPSCRILAGSVAKGKSKMRSAGQEIGEKYDLSTDGIGGTDWEWGFDE